MPQPRAEAIFKKKTSHPPYKKDRRVKEIVKWDIPTNYEAFHLAWK
jgi:hypothetical protein